jgi:hypothetical protein
MAMAYIMQLPLHLFYLFFVIFEASVATDTM